MKFILCTTTNKLHIDGCHHLKGVMAEHRKEFDSIEEAEYACDKKIILLQTLCFKRIGKGEMI